MIEITEFKFTYTHFEKGPISHMVVHIIAKNRKEAELIALDYNWKFFNQDCSVVVEEGLKGYRND